MNKSKQRLKERRAFVASQVKRRSKEKVEIVINQIADGLFLSAGTIWNDLKTYREETTA